MRLTTEQHKDYWKNRKIDWNASYLSTWDHPHRNLIIEVLRTFPWRSLWEIGCGPGANLVKIAKEIPGRELGGNDINPEAIALAQVTFKNAMFEVSSCEDVLLSDKACDVTLSDMTLIYVGPTRIKKVLKEIKRFTRNRIVLVEFDSKKWWRRLWLLWKSGYHAHNYKKLLEDCGYYDYMSLRIPSKFYPGASKIHDEFATIISAKC
jgi:ubiquinone/menaquinone biosynthesis C-methylase UbiE